MRNILFLVLIAIAVCATIDFNNQEEVEKVLQAIDWGKAWNEVCYNLQKAKDFLVRTGLWGVIKTALSTVGAAAATAACTAWGVPGWICGSMVEFVAAAM